MRKNPEYYLPEKILESFLNASINIDFPGGMDNIRMSGRSTKDNADLISAMVEEASEKGIRFSPGEVSVLWTCLAAKVWNEAMSGPTAEDLETLFKKADSAVEKLVSEHGLDPDRDFSDKLIGGELVEFDKNESGPRTAIITPPSFSVLDSKRVTRDAYPEAYIEWLLKYVSSSTAASFFARLASSGANQETWNRRQYIKKTNRGSGALSGGNGFSEWIRFVDEALSRDALPMWQGPPEKNLFALLLPILLEWSEAASFGKEAPDAPVPGFYTELSGSWPPRTDFIVRVLLSWMDKGDIKRGLFLGAGLLGMFLQKTPASSEAKKAHVILKKLPGVKKQAMLEWEEILGDMKALWGEDGSRIPKPSEEWSTLHADMYRRLCGFLTLAFGADGKTAAKMMKEYPPLRNRSFLFARAGSGALSDISLGTRLMAMGVRFDFDVSSGSGDYISKEEIYSRIFLESGYENLDAEILSAPITDEDRDICNMLCDFLSGWFDFKNRELVKNKKNAIVPGAAKWKEMETREREDIHTPAELLCMCAVQKAIKSRDIQGVLDVLGRPELWADGIRGAFGLAPVFGKTYPVRREYFFKSGMFREIVSENASKVPAAAAGVIFRLSVTESEYLELLGKDELERTVRAAEFSPGSPDAPWSDRLSSTKTSRALCFLDDGVPGVDKGNVRIAGLPETMGMFRARFRLYGGRNRNLPQWKGNVSGPSFSGSVSAVVDGKPYWYPGDIDTPEMIYGKNIRALLGNEVINAPAGETFKRLDSICRESLSDFAESGAWKDNPGFWEELRNHLADSGGEMSPAACHTFFRSVSRAYRRYPTGLSDEILGTPLEFGMSYRTESEPCHLNEPGKAPVMIFSSECRKNIISSLGGEKAKLAISFSSKKPLPLWFFLDISGYSPVTARHALFPAETVVNACMEGTIETGTVSFSERIASGAPVPPNPVWMDIFAEKTVRETDIQFGNRNYWGSFPDNENTPLFIGPEIIRFLADRNLVESYVTSSGERAAEKDAVLWGKGSALRTLVPDSMVTSLYSDTRLCFINTAINGLRNISDMLSAYIGTPDTDEAGSVACVSLGFICGFSETLEKIKEAHPGFKNNKPTEEKARELEQCLARAAVLASKICEEENPGQGFFDVF